MTEPPEPAGLAAGAVLRAAGTEIRLLVPSALTGGRYSVAEYALPAGFAGPPPHVHATFEHTWYVLAGTVAVTFDGSARALAAGEAVHVPAGVAHTFANPAAEPARLLAVDAPGGLEGYYAELAAAFPAGVPLDRAVVSAIQQRYDTRPAS